MKGMKTKILSVLLLASMLLQCVFVSYAVTPTTDEIVEKAAEIIRSNEGDYISVKADDNGALSIGWIQWHGNRALNLLKDIVSANTANAKSILGTTLYTEITTSTDWSTRIVSEDEKAKISTLLGTEEGRAEQDKLAAANILSYVEHGKKLGIFSPAALVYFADVENQCGSGGAARVAASAATLAGSGEITLAILHQAALADAAAGKSSIRREKVYNYAYLLGWENDLSAEAYEVWTTDYTLNIRSGAGTTYEKVGQYQSGVSVIVYEKTTVGTENWGRTDSGWICLDYCTFVRSHTPSANTFSVKFDANGATLNTKALSVIGVTAVNKGRGTNELIVFTSSYGASTGTNEYGAEVAVTSDGIAQNTPKYGINNSTIPTGGFVASAHGTALTELCKSIVKGNYVVYNSADMTLEAYDSYQTYIAANKKAVSGAAIGTLPTPTREGYTFDGWYDSNGNKFTSTTVVSATSEFTLTARWTPVSVKVMFNNNGGSSSQPVASTSANGVNIYRNTDMLVVYDSGRGTSTKTNKYGSEAAVNSAGIVTQLWAESATGTEDHNIPEGGFVISGHGKSSKWITSNISVGSRIEFDYDTLTLSVYADGVDVASSITATFGQKLGTLPSPTKDGYIFAGWYDENGTQYTYASVSVFTEDTILYAKWKEAGTSTEKLRGDVDEDGVVSAVDLLCLASEIKAPGSTGYTNIDIDEDGIVAATDLLALAIIIKNGG